MSTYFLSDLHLTPEKPTITQAFVDFLNQQAPFAEKVYILGDLFEYWVGEDGAKFIGAEPILNAMQQAADKTPCYFIAGNRDFLVTDKFTELTGFTILADETVIDLYGTPTLILHGDSLCTDDIAHQQFRQQITTNEAWKKQFLSLPLNERIKQAKMAREKSHEHKQSISMGIMDVTEKTVLDTFQTYNVKAMIHGHTHRQNVHHYTIDEQTVTRTVLGDWHDQSSLVKASNQGLEFINLAI